MGLSEWFGIVRFAQTRNAFACIQALGEALLEDRWAEPTLT